MHMATIAVMVIAAADIRRVIFGFEFMILAGPFYISYLLKYLYE